MPPAFPPRTVARRSGFLRALVWLVLLGLLLVNSAVWVQARAMTRFVPGGQPLDQFAAAPLSDKVK